MDERYWIRLLPWRRRNTNADEQHRADRTPYLLVEAKRLVCTNHECRAEIIALQRSAFETHNFHCTCGSELKRIYHTPVVTPLGAVPDNFHLHARTRRLLKLAGRN